MLLLVGCHTGHLETHEVPAPQAAAPAQRTDRPPSRAAAPETEPERHSLDARTVEELRALAQAELVRVEGMHEVTDGATPLRGARFFVYADLPEEGLDRRCRPHPGSLRDGELMLTIRGPRDAQGGRSVHELLLSGGVVVTDGGYEGPGGGGAMGGFSQLPYIRVEATPRRWVYASEVDQVSLSCVDAERTVSCSNGGQASCSTREPAVRFQAAPAGSSGSAGSSLGGAVASGSASAPAGAGDSANPAEATCTLECAPEPCDEAIDGLAFDKRMYGGELTYLLGVFRGAAECRAFAAEREPLLPRLEALHGYCECGSCEAESDDEAIETCIAACEHRCEERDRAVGVTRG